MRHRSPRRTPHVRIAALLVVAGWLTLGSWLVPQAQRLPDLLLTDNTEFVAPGTESARAAALSVLVTGPPVTYAVVLYERDGGLRTEDANRIAADHAWIATLPGVRAPLPPPLPSTDGQAVGLAIPTGGPDGRSAAELVSVLRTALPDHDGLRVRVGGGAGLDADLQQVFAQIDGRLLAVTVAVVLVILLGVYRSPFLWIPPLLSVAVADVTATAIVAHLVEQDLTRLYGLSLSVMTVLVFGAGTDYSMLLIARLREEYASGHPPPTAVRRAVRGCAGAVVASGGTVVASLLCLLAAESNLTRSLAVAGAVGVTVAVVASLSLLPALLLVGGPTLYWPGDPRRGRHRAGVWLLLATFVARAHRPVWFGVVALLLCFGMSAPTLRSDWTPVERLFTTDTESVSANDKLTRFGQPETEILVPVRAAYAEQVSALVAATSGVRSVRHERAPDPGDPMAWRDRDLVRATVPAAAESAEAEATVRRVRAALAALPPEAEALVGGLAAERIDGRAVAERDRWRLLPLILLVILVLLVLLLRSLVAPLVLIGTVVLSLLAAVGLSLLVFDRLFGSRQVDNTFVVLTFVFLAALGVDYNIFLIHRVDQEAGRLGTRAGLRAATTATGGVITSAGVVLAATFAALLTLPLLALFQVGFAVALGVLLDTFIVRSLLVPALFHDFARWIWWPRRVPLDARSTAAGIPSMPSERVGVDGSTVMLGTGPHVSPTSLTALRLP